MPLTGTILKGTVPTGLGMQQYPGECLLCEIAGKPLKLFKRVCAGWSVIPIPSCLRRWNLDFGDIRLGRELEKINKLRNRLAHHEPVCFAIGHAVIDTTYARQHYVQIVNLFNWMGIDEGSLLYGVNHLNNTLAAIDSLQI